MKFLAITIFLIGLAQSSGLDDGNEPQITAPPVVRRQESRNDFIGWYSWLGTYDYLTCKGSSTYSTYNGYYKCCASGSCLFPTGCSRGYILFRSSSRSCRGASICSSDKMISYYGTTYTSLTNYWCDTYTLTGDTIYRQHPLSYSLTASSRTTSSTSFQSQTSSSPTSFPTPEPGPGPDPKPKSNVGAIIGGIIGGLVLLSGFGAFALLLWHKRRQQVQEIGALNAGQRPASMLPDFGGSSSGPPPGGAPLGGIVSPGSPPPQYVSQAPQTGMMQVAGFTPNPDSSMRKEAPMPAVSELPSPQHTGQQWR